MTTVHYRTQKVGEVELFYREAGPAVALVLLLLHGFPTASHMFRDLIPELVCRYRLIAPDLPGFGQTKAPDRGAFTYSFDKLAEVIEGFVDAIGLGRFALYIFDYGAPTGLRLAVRHPEPVTGIIQAEPRGAKKETIGLQFDDVGSARHIEYLCGPRKADPE